MFGAYRLILAICVVIEHTGAPFGWKHIHFKNPGVWAVVQFFMLSGFVMCSVFEKNYSKAGMSTVYFYLDRYLRVFPPYLCVVVLVIFVEVILGLDASSLKLSLSKDYYSFEFWKLLACNLSIIPMNYFMFFPSINSLFFIPQAWSLALEEQLYLVFPLLSKSRVMELIVSILGLIIFTFAIFGKIDPHTWSYYLLPGTIFYFMVGKNLYKITTVQALKDLKPIKYGKTGSVLVLLWFSNLYLQKIFALPDSLQNCLVYLPPTILFGSIVFTNLITSEWTLSNLINPIKFELFFVSSILVYFCALFKWTEYTGWLRAYYNTEQICGLLFGVCAIFLLSFVKRNRLDDLLGGMSYGTFLTHYFFIWFLNRIHIFPDMGSPSARLSVLGLSLGTALLMHLWIERPMEVQRKKIRSKFLLRHKVQESIEPSKQPWQNPLTQPEL